MLRIDDDQTLSRTTSFLPVLLAHHCVPSSSTIQLGGTYLKVKQ